MGDIMGKRVLVNGSSSGIGEAVARAFAARDVRVIRTGAQTSIRPSGRKRSLRRRDMSPGR